MKRKDELKIDALSGIDDRFIDKVSARRYELFFRKRFPKWIIPSSVAAAVLVAIMIPVLFMLFMKQVPIYEGMTVLENYNGTSSVSIEPKKRGNGFEFLSDKKDNNGNNGNNGNHYGQNKKPVDEIIEDDTSIGIEIPEQKMYYADPNQDIYINVHISNPDNFEILSFTLNGKKYSSYMFEDGSDMENLILKVNVGDAKGVIEYTIDAIKYVDGTEIKDVVMEGDRTIKVGVYSAGIQPKASTGNEFIGINEVSFDVELADKFELIKRCGGKAYAFICDDESVLESRTIELEENKVEFKNLKTDTTYRYGVFAYYDALDGKGMQKHILFEKEFTTHSVVAIGDPVAEQEAISFNVVFDELFKSKKLSSMTLYFGENKVRELDVSGDITKKTFTVAELLSNNEYRLVLAYENLGKTETVEFTLKTLAKATPDLTLTEIEKTQTSFKFDIAVTDIDSVGAVTKIELVHGEDVTNVEDLATREFVNLLSNNDYMVKVTYTYDLNDGVGNQTLVKELTVKTEAKAEPTFTIKDVTADLYTVKGSYDQTNVDNTLISYSVKLYKGDELIKENADKKIEFDSLDYYTDYTVKINYTFDANDGKGVQTKTVEQTVKTLPYLNVEAMTTRNATALFDGDTIYVQANIINPCGIKVTHVTVNGNKYKVSSSSTATQLFVEIVCDETLGGGNVELKIDRIYAELEDASYETTVDSEASATVFINGPFEILNVEFVDENYERIYWHFRDDTFYVKFTFNNPTGYEITELFIRYGYGGSVLNVGIDHLMKISNNEYVVSSEFAHVSNSSTLEFEIHYKNQYVEASTDPFSCTQKVVELWTKQIQYISSAEELLEALDRGGNRYYQLTSDIDLSGQNWEPRDFWGVIDGNGYAIKNYTVTGLITERGFGLISALYGAIYNLNMENAFVMMNGSSVDMYKGLFANFNKGLIQNCTIDSNTIVNLYEASYVYFGSFAGNNGGTIEGCTNNANISYANECGAIAHSNSGIIRNCVNNGNINSPLVCGIANGGTIQNCTNNGTIEGFKSYGISKCGILTNCVNNGNILAKSQDEYQNEDVEAYGISESGTEINCTNNGTVTIQYYEGSEETEE